MPKSSTQKLAALAEALFEKTQNGELRWQPTPQEDVYFTTLGDYRVLLYETRTNMSSTPDINIALHQGDTVVERFADPDLLGITPRRFDGFYSLMLALFNMAAAQATGADKAVDELLNLLGRGS